MRRRRRRSFAGTNGELALQPMTEQILSLDASGAQVHDSAGPQAPQTPPALTGLAMTGDVLTWDREGVAQTVMLSPTG